MMRTSRAIRRTLLGIVALTAIGAPRGAALGSPTPAAPGSPPAATGDGVEVADTPVRGYPVIRTDPTVPQPDGTVRRRQAYAAALVGPFIAAGGDFLRIETPSGDVLEQPYFAAWKADDGALICPSLRFDDQVLAVVEGPVPTTAYVSGRFQHVVTPSGAVARNRIALVDLATCAVDRRFDAGAVDDRIDHLVFRAGRLFAGGDFTTIGGLARDVVVELDPVTGAVRPSFDPEFSGSLDAPVRALAITPDGARLIVAGKFGTVSANGRSLTTESAIFEINDRDTPRLTDHSWRSPHDLLFQTDASVSPDGRWIAFVYRGTPFPGRNVFLVAAIDGAQREQWSHDTGNSVFGVGLSDATVYISGHFCRIAGGPGPTVPMEPSMGVTDCAQHPEGAWRTHLAALSLADGTPLPWNPGHDSQTGGRAIVVTRRGVFTAFDGMRSAGLRVGALAVFPTDGTVVPPPPPPPPPPTSDPDAALDGTSLDPGFRPAVRGD